jgi:hypothetical protein
MRLAQSWDWQLCVRYTKMADDLRADRSAAWKRRAGEFRRVLAE